jgi:hypothetical protein
MRTAAPLSMRASAPASSCASRDMEHSARAERVCSSCLDAVAHYGSVKSCPRIVSVAMRSPVLSNTTSWKAPRPTSWMSTLAAPSTLAMYSLLAKASSTSSGSSREDIAMDEETPDREKLVDAWLGEARHLSETGRASGERADRAFGLGVTVIIGASAVGLANETADVLLGVPTALALLMAYVVQVYSDVAALGAGRRRIEQCLAQELKTEVLMKETRIAPVRHESGVSALVVLAMLLLLVGTLTAGAIRAAGHSEAWILPAFAVASLVSVAAAVLGWVDMLRTPAATDQSVADWPDAPGYQAPAPLPLRIRLVASLRWARHASARTAGARNAEQ